MLQVDYSGGCYRLVLDRPRKRNAINAEMLDALEAAVGAIPAQAGVVLLAARGPHFCAGLDLGEHQGRDAAQVFAISRRWQQVFGHLRDCGRPLVVALSGAVIGGGLELAALGHIRVADETTFYQLPEGRHGVFVGGGGSVSIARILGADRMGEMMLTGRRLEAEEGARLGLSHYLVPKGSARARAESLAARVLENAPLANWAIVAALPRIAEMGAGPGGFVESLTAAFTQTGPDVGQRIGQFLATGTKERADEIC